MSAGAASLTRAQVREVDRIAIDEFGIPGIVLMENAGLGATLELLPMLDGRSGPVVVLCGGGNNGGDGYVIARQLANRSVSVVVYSTKASNELAGDALTNREIVDRMGIEVRSITGPPEIEAAQAEWRGAALVVDALLGTGFTGEVRAPLTDVIAALELSGTGDPGDGAVPVVAVDLPSGLDCDRGTPSNATVRADRTLTFVARKAGFDVPGSEAWTGEVRVVPIGAPAAAVERAREVVR